LLIGVGHIDSLLETLAAYSLWLAASDYLCKNNEQHPMFQLNCKGRILRAEHPLVMGIINATPDSFYDQSRFSGTDAILSTAVQMLTEGATILDIGGLSTRPGSVPVSVAEETDRVCAPIERIHREHPEAFMSIDTYRAPVAEAAIAAGACIVNDISAGRLDPDLLPLVVRQQVPYVLMHMQGTPATMQADPQYADVTATVLDFLTENAAALRSMGISDILTDPGFGFGKTVEHNFTLLRDLERLTALPYPLLLGVSRKSFITKTLGIKAADALNGTTAVHMAGLLKGASILRVHDVKAAVEAVKLVTAMQ
jgi:dihydropteroate synthase